MTQRFPNLADKDWHFYVESVTLSEGKEVHVVSTDVAQLLFGLEGEEQEVARELNVLASVIVDAIQFKPDFFTVFRCI